MKKEEAYKQLRKLKDSELFKQLKKLSKEEDIAIRTNDNVEEWAIGVEQSRVIHILMERNLL